MCIPTKLQLLLRGLIWSPSNRFISPLASSALLVKKAEAKLSHLASGGTILFKDPPPKRLQRHSQKLGEKLEVPFRGLRKAFPVFMKTSKISSCFRRPSEAQENHTQKAASLPWVYRGGQFGTPSRWIPRQCYPCPLTYATFQKFTLKATD